MLLSATPDPSAAIPRAAWLPQASPATPPADRQAAHRVRVGQLAERLAQRLCLDAPTSRLLRLAAPLHDIGAIDPPDWTPAPASAGHRQRQPHRGTALLAGSRLPLFKLAAEIALHLHERWDGNGYPRGLAGEAIPLTARIVAVVDCFDTLTQRHTYRPNRADDRALAMLAAQAGSAFDPAVVAVFSAHSAELIALRDHVDATRAGPPP
jgi:putative two-component system response regulator